MKKALIIIDIQNDYFEGGNKPLQASLEASLKAQKILDRFRENNLFIVHIQHIANREGATFFLPNTLGVDIHSTVYPKSGETIIFKHFPNSFRETNLLEVLQNNDITDLVILGMMSHMCVDATTRAAKDFGFNCTIIEDACASCDQEINGYSIKAQDVHKSFMAALNYMYASVVPAEDYLNS